MNVSSAVEFAKSSAAHRIIKSVRFYTYFTIVSQCQFIDTFLVSLFLGNFTGIGINFNCFVLMLDFA